VAERGAAAPPLRAGFQAKVNDFLVPWLRFERGFGPPVGMSLLAVGKLQNAA